MKFGPLWLVILSMGAMHGCDLDPGEVPEGGLGDPDVCLEGPVVGTCMEALWGDCEPPSGTCSLGALSQGAAFVWASGHAMGFTAEEGGGEAVLIAGVGPAGETCFTGTRTLDASANRASTAWTSNTGEDFHVVEGGDGSVAVTCPDDTRVALDTLEPLVWSHCLQAGTEGGVCDFAGLGALYSSRTAPRVSETCGSRTACPSGSVCCPGGGGAPYCSPACF